jgi:signal transduction histidine kinase
MKSLLKLLAPSSLVNRVFALYGISLALFVGGGLFLFLNYQFKQHVEDTEVASIMLIEVVFAAVQDSAVIGDFDTVHRLLNTGLQGSQFSSAQFIATGGGNILAENKLRSSSSAPAWLVHRIKNSLDDVSRIVSVGGHDYGIVRLQFDSQAVALRLWSVSLLALGGGLLCLIAGLIVIRVALARWLGGLLRLRETVEGLGVGAAHSPPLVIDNAPAEIQSLVDMVNQTSLLLREREITRAALQASEARWQLSAERLSERTAQLDAIFDLSPDGFVSFDAAHCIRYVSPAFVRLTGLDEGAMMGLDAEEFSERLASICQPAARFPGFAALSDAGGTPPKNRQTIELADADKRVLQVGLRLSEEETVSQILYFRDITHETEVDRLKSEFLSHAAHELRTPMQSIYGFTEVLMTQELDEADRADFLSTIFRQSELMIGIINELLDLARIEARRGKDFALARIDVRTLLQEIVTGFKTPGTRPAPQVTHGSGPLSVSADRQKLIQAISNVISNAYKYSPDGGAVGIELVPPTRENMLIGIRITDHGIGMTPEQLAQVCERFYRADASGNIPGTGLGMSIVKEIVELHGGHIEFESEVGAGTTVTLCLPEVAAAVLTQGPDVLPTSPKEQQT